FLSLQSAAFLGHGLSLLGRRPLPSGSQGSCLSRRSQPTSIQGNYALRFKYEPYHSIYLKSFVFYINLFYYEINSTTKKYPSSSTSLNVIKECKKNQF